MEKQAEHTSEAKPRQVAYIRYARKPFSKKTRIVAAVIAALIVLGLIVGCWYKGTQMQSAYIEHDKYQAVFLTNNQVYFGKVQLLADRSVRMTDVYYLQSQTAAQAENEKMADPSQSGGTKATPQLIKLGSELHGPEDAIMFSKEQVLFWENLKSDSKVAKAIDVYKKK
jgi:hypothetical protein